MNLHVDLGQLIITTAVGIVAWYVKKFSDRLDKHEQVLFDMNGILTRAVGSVDILFRLLDVDRRKSNAR